MLAPRLTTLALAISAVVLAVPPSALAERPAVTVRPDAFVGRFQPSVTDYALRCDDNPVKVRVSGAKGWVTAAGGGELSRGGSSTTLKGVGKRAVVRMQHRGGAPVKRYSLRCLPADFPEYSFDRARKGGPKLFSIQMVNRYAAIFNDDGAPVWWYQAEGHPDDFQVLDDGTITYAPVDITSDQFSKGGFLIRDLDGRKIRTVAATDELPTDIHEIELLPNGHYVIGAQTAHPGVDTTAFGGAPDTTVAGIQIQELTKKGRLVNSWDSFENIALDETGRWWDDPLITTYEPYDVVHWNSVDVRGNRLLISFRHLDAVYAVNHKTGNIIWKLGGTETADSLRVVGDEHSDYPLGGQHDARFGPGGTITIYDNQTDLADPEPRAVRYRIDVGAGTAKLIEQVSDRNVPASFCCGSARPDEDGDWLIGWGGFGYSAAYNSRGRRIYSIQTPGGFSYRTLPVPAGAVSVAELRGAMDKLARR